MALVIKTIPSGFSNESSILLAHLLGSRCLSNHPTDEITIPSRSSQSVHYHHVPDE